MPAYKVRDGRPKPWHAEFPHPVTKKRIYGPYFRTKAEAVQWEQDERDIMARSPLYKPGAGRIKFPEFVQYTFMPQRNVARATAARDRAIMPRLAYWDLYSLGDIMPSDVRKWAKMLAETETPNVADKALTLFRSILELAKLDGTLPLNPADGASVPAPPPHEDRVLTDAEVHEIVYSMPWVGYTVFTKLLAETGLRWGEAAALPERLVDTTERVVRVRWTMEKDGTVKELLKGGDAAYRDVPLPGQLVQDITVWRGLKEASPWHPAGGGFEFMGRYWAKLQYDNYNARIWKPALAAAGIAKPWPTPHDLRHYYGTKLGEAGIGEANIGALLGHAPNSRITRRYVQPTQSRLDQARDVFDR